MQVRKAMITQTRTSSICVGSWKRDQVLYGHTKFNDKKDGDDPMGCTIWTALVIIAALSVARCMAMSASMAVIMDAISHLVDDPLMPLKLVHILVP